MERMRSLCNTSPLSSLSAFLKRPLWPTGQKSIDLITPEFSAYLDLIRFAAAVAVFLSHMVTLPFTDDILPWRLGSYGDAAVIVFFVLSGFVIAYVANTKEDRPKAFLIARISRLYSVVLLALPFTFLCDWAGITLNSDFYRIKKVLWEEPTWQGYLSSFFFLNEYQILNLDGVAPGTNGPFWSMSFEATYYLLIGILLFFPAIVSVPLTAIILFAAGKTISALFPAWLLGFSLYFWIHKIKPGKVNSGLLFLISTGMIIFFLKLFQCFRKITLGTLFHGREDLSIVQNTLATPT